MAKGDKHPGGRPQYADGAYLENNISDLIYHHSDFLNESELQKHTIRHIKDIVDEPIISMREELSIPPSRNRKQSKFRIDVVAITESGHYLIECKSPASKAVTSLVNGVAQLQLYGIVYENVTGIKPKLMLVCNKINEFLTAYMREYAPEVMLTIVGKDYSLRLQHAGT